MNDKPILKQSIDFNEPETFSECFTQNGKVSVLAIDKIIEGRMNLRQFCSSLHKQFKGCMHFEVTFFFRKYFFFSFRSRSSPNQSNIVLKSTKLRDGRRAILNRSYWNALRSDNVVVSMGIHEDVFVKESGEWRCQSRTISHSGKNGPLDPNRSAPLSSKI